MISSLSSPRPLSLLAGGALVLTLVAGTANGAILFQDNFSGLGTNPLNGTTPDVTQGTTAWVGDTEYKADGTGTATAGTNPSIRAYLTLGGLIANGELNATNSTFRAVGIGGGVANGDFNFFELSQIPEPGSLALVALGGVFLASRRRK